MVVVFLGLSSGSNDELPPLGSRQAAMPMPASIPCARQSLPLRPQRGVVAARQRLVDHGMIVAAVVGAAARDRVGKLVWRMKLRRRTSIGSSESLAATSVHGALDREIGRRLAEAAHRFLRRLVGGDGDARDIARCDPIGSDDGADRLAQLERRTPGIGADIVERAHLHRADHALVVERDLDVEHALRAVRVAAAHVFQPVLDEAHRHGRAASQDSPQARRA